MSDTTEKPRMSRVDRVRLAYPGASDRDIDYYLDLRDEGHSQYVAAVMAGLRDPDEGHDA